ncbi:MAG: isochorismatase family protein [Candidatus Woesearchaeota archaeon]
MGRIKTILKYTFLAAVISGVIKYDISYNKDFDKQVTIQNLNINTIVQKPIAKTKPLLTGNTALFIIDMQNSWLEDIDSIELKTEIPNQIKVINYFISHHNPIYVFEYADMGKTTPILRKEIDRYPNKQYFLKEGQSAFSTRDSLEKILYKQNIRNVIVMGINASGCVKETVIDLLSAQYTFKKFNETDSLSLQLNVLLSNDIIADPRTDYAVRRVNDRLESGSWYRMQKNCFFRDTYEELFTLLNHKEQ